MSTASLPAASSSADNTGNSSSSSTAPPFPAYLSGSRLLIWDLTAAQLLRQQYRVVGECRSTIVQPARSSTGVGQLLGDEKEEQWVAAVYSSVPVHYSLHQTHWLLQHGLITLLDGSDVTALRTARFRRDGDNSDSGDSRALSAEERRLYLIRYMQQANKQKHSKRAQHGEQAPTTPAAVLTGAQVISTPTASTVTPPPTPFSQQPPFSTYAVAEALLTESSASAAVPLSSLPVPIVSHCSPFGLSLSSQPASSSALSRLQSLCSERSIALLSRAFADLHSRRYVVTAGQLYGGDLLLYADDPADCHAHSIVSVRGADQSSISALDLLTVARIASGVSKGVVLAYETAERGEMAYLSVNWQASLSAVPYNAPT